MLKIKKTIHINKKLSKGSIERISCPGSKKFSIIYSSKGRRTKFFINEKDIATSSDSYHCHEDQSDFLEIKVCKGCVWIEKCVFFEEERVEIDDSNIYDFCIFGIIV